MIKKIIEKIKKIGKWIALVASIIFVILCAGAFIAYKIYQIKIKRQIKSTDKLISEIKESISETSKKINDINRMLNKL